MPYYWIGIKAYDLVSGKQLVKKSYYVSKTKALEEFPMLKSDKLCGALVYYDGGCGWVELVVCLFVCLFVFACCCFSLNDIKT